MLTELKNYSRDVVTANIGEANSVLVKMRQTVDEKLQSTLEPVWNIAWVTGIELQHGRIISQVV